MSEAALRLFSYLSNPRLAKATITCDGVGVTTSDNALLHFEKIRRPIFPLDWNTAP